MSFKKVFLPIALIMFAASTLHASLELIGIGSLAMAGGIGLERTAAHVISSLPELRVPYFFLGGFGVQYLATCFNQEKVEPVDDAARIANKYAEFGADAFWAAFCASMGITCFQVRETNPITALIGCVCALQGAPAAVRCMKALFGNK